MKLEDENQLLVRIAKQKRGSVASAMAINKLIKLNGGLIWKVARRLQASGEYSYLDDIISVCRISILISLKTYKFDKGALFITWWVYNMRAAVQVWRREQRGELYLYQYIKDKKYDKVSSKSVAAFKSFRDVELEITNQYNGSTYEADLKKIMSNAGGVMGEWSVDGDKEVEASVIDICKQFEGLLTEREIKVMEYRYDHKMPFWKIGEALSLSMEGARNVFDKALAKLKEEMKAAA